MVGEAPRSAWLVVQDLVQQHPRRAAKGQLAGQHLVEDHAEAVDVAAAVDAVAFALACSGSYRRACREPGRRSSWLHLAGFALGEAEVHQPCVAVLVEHDVGGLDVAMDDAHFVRVLQRIGDCGHQLRDLAQRPPFFREQVSQRDAFDEFANQEGQAGRLSHLVDGYDRRMPQLSDAGASRRNRSLSLALVNWPARGILIATTRSSSGSRALVNVAERARSDDLDQLVSSQSLLDFSGITVDRHGFHRRR